MVKRRIMGEDFHVQSDRAARRGSQYGEQARQPSGQPQFLPGQATALLQLQRLCGNDAVARYVLRQSQPASPSTAPAQDFPSGVQELTDAIALASQQELPDIGRAVQSARLVASAVTSSRLVNVAVTGRTYQVPSTSLPDMETLITGRSNLLDLRQVIADADPHRQRPMIAAALQTALQTTPTDQANRDLVPVNLQAGRLGTGERLETYPDGARVVITQPARTFQIIREDLQSLLMTAEMLQPSQHDIDVADAAPGELNAEIARVFVLMTPILGTAVAILEATTRQSITGNELSDGERALLGLGAALSLSEVFLAAGQYVAAARQLAQVTRIPAPRILTLMRNLVQLSAGERAALIRLAARAERAARMQPQRVAARGLLSRADTTIAGQLLRRVSMPSVRVSRRVATALTDRLGAGQPIIVNIGGAGARHEPPTAININPNIVARRPNIPQHVQAFGEDIGSLFPGGSVDRVVAFGLADDVLNWDRVAAGAFRVLKPGGRVDIRFRWPTVEDAGRLQAALRRAGFHDIRVQHHAIVTATRP